MWINNFLKLPIIKLIAMIALIYYIFNESKDDPRSASHHFTKENINKSLDTIKKNIDLIASSQEKINQLKNDENYENQKIKNINLDQKIDLNIQDIRQGSGDNLVVCGSEVTINYDFINENNNDVVNKSNATFNVGDKFNELIERGLIGMRPGGIRVIKIPKNFIIGDKIYDELIQSSNMIYKILLLKVSDLPSKHSVCYE
jgi:FKBP-type peptidyl-prolyl cis-trans isomerase